jgi:hypothetical protein
MGLPLSVLAAFIERPFVTRAGFERNAIWFSLQANFVSLLVGYLATMVVIPLVMSPVVAIGLIWPFVALGISVAIERQYLNMRLRNGLVSWAPIATGNVISAVVCIAVMVFAASLRDDVPHLCANLRNYEVPMNVSAAVGSLVLLVGSFAITNSSGSPRPTTEQSVGRGPADNADLSG